MTEAIEQAAGPTWKLQRCMTDLILDAQGGSAFEKDPMAFGEDRGLGRADQAALEKFKSRLLVYRDLARNALEDPLPDCFPITHGLLEEAGLWDDCVDAFLASRTIQSAYYRDVNPAFVAWLAESAWGLERWPFLLQLAHFEYIEVEILRWPDLNEGDRPVASLPLRPPRAPHAVSGQSPATASDESALPDLKHIPDADSRVVFDGATRNLAYAFRVHEATKDGPKPAAGETFLLGYRDAEGDFAYSELSAHASAFLARCLEGESVGAAASALNLELEEVLALLTRFKENGAFLGFR